MTRSAIAGPARLLVAAALATPLMLAPGLAQDASDGGTSAVPDAGSMEGARLDLPVAAVGDTEITRQDVADAIAGLPAEMRQQPSETLVPAVVDQLVSRELILRAARDAGLAEDPAVAELAGSEPGPVEEDNALVQLYLERELEGAVSEDAVQATYDAAQAQADSELPPLESVRPQIERQLRMDAFDELRTDLAEGVAIVFYDAEGEPQEVTMTPRGPVMTGSGGSGSNSE